MTESLSPAAVVEQVEFVKGIVTVPEDDTRRLVYADWLEEHGEPERAEFIRVQVELSRMKEAGNGIVTEDDGHTCIDDPCPVCGSVERYDSLRRRQGDLWNYGASGHWVVDDPIAFAYCIRCIDEETISTAATTHDPIAIYRRGFVAHVTCTAADWLANAEQLYWHPNQKCDCVGGFHPLTECGHCLGTGFRPFPAHQLPHPITAVTLTTLPDFVHETRPPDRHAYRLTSGERWLECDQVVGLNDPGARPVIALGLLAAEFPSITFLPPTPA